MMDQFSTNRTWSSPTAQGGNACYFLVGLLTVVLSHYCDSALGQLNFQMDEGVAAAVAVLPPRDVQNALVDAEIALKTRQFPAAFKLLQGVLQQPEDYFVDETFKKTTKSIAVSILEGLSDEAYGAYELQVGLAASQSLQGAIAGGRWEEVSLLAQTAPCTAAGDKAQLLLAQRQLDRGEFSAAFHRLKRLAASSRARSNLGSGLIALVQMTAKLAGQTFDVSALPLLDSDRQPITMGGISTAVPLDSEAVDRLVAAILKSASQSPGFSPASVWLLPGGGPARTGHAGHASAAGGATWIHEVDEAPELTDQAELQPLWLADLKKQRELVEQLMIERQNLVVPSAVPVIAQDKVICRGLADVAAYSVGDGALAWRTSLVDPALRSLYAQELGLAADDEAPINEGMKEYLRQRVYRDSTAGQISTDGELVYYIDELGFNGLPFAVQPDRQGGLPENNLPNRLVACSARTGKVVWVAGGPATAAKRDLEGTFFLGAPVPSKGLLFVLADQQGELRLLVLQGCEPGAGVHPQAGTLLWSQALATGEPGNSPRVIRRLSGLSPSIAEDVVVCPTGMGLVVAIDIVTRQLKWGFRYESIRGPRSAEVAIGRPGTVLQEDEQSRWLDSFPVMTGGRVLLTPRDDSHLYCLDLLSGVVLWKRNREAALSIAGFDRDKLITLTLSGVNALSLADGTDAWPTAVVLDRPSGRAICGQRVIHVPVVTGQVVSIDLSTRRVLARLPLATNVLPGNLVAAAGYLVVANSRQVAAIQSNSRPAEDLNAEELASTLKVADIAKRGEERLTQGKTELGIADLRSVLESQPPIDVANRARQVLLAALLDGLKHDPQLYRSTFDEAERLAISPAERVQVYLQHGSVLEESQDRLAAFEVYLKGFFLPEAQVTGMGQLPDGSECRIERLLAGRLNRLYEQTGETLKLEMQKLALTQFEAQANQFSEIELLRRRLRLTLESQLDRVLLASRLIDLLTAPAQLSERYWWLFELARSSEPGIAAYGHARLVELLVEQKSYYAAIDVLTAIEQKFPSVNCWSIGRSMQAAEGTPTGPETGTQFAQRMKQIRVIEARLPGPRFWESRSVAAKRFNRSVDSSQLTARVEVLDSVDPLFTDWSFSLADNGNLLQGADAEGQVEWRVATEFGDQDFVMGNVRQLGMVQYHHLRHRGGIIVLSQGDRFNLYNGLVPGSSPEPIASLSVLSGNRGGDDDVTVQAGRYLYPNGRRIPTAIDRSGSPVGHVCGIARDLVIYQEDKSLRGVNLLTGEPVWKFPGIPKASEVAVDDDLIVAYVSTTNGEYEARLISPTDGAYLGKLPSPPPGDRLWQQGRWLLSVTRMEGRSTLVCTDWLKAAPVWQLPLVDESRVTTVAHDEVIVAHPSGNVRSFDLLSGRQRWESTIQPVPGIAALAAKRYAEALVLVVGQPITKQVRINGPDYFAMPFDGVAYGLDGQTGVVRWTMSIELSTFDTLQPNHVPLVSFTARVMSPPQLVNGRQTLPAYFNLTIVDIRTGELVYRAKDTSLTNSTGVRLNANAKAVEFGFGGWVLEVQYRNEAESPRVDDAPADVEQPAEADGDNAE
jgi:outer membrane protein assembly factor BamB